MSHTSTDHWRQVLVVSPPPPPFPALSSKATRPTMISSVEPSLLRSPTSHPSLPPLFFRRHSRSLIPRSSPCPRARHTHAAITAPQDLHHFSRSQPLDYSPQSPFCPRALGDVVTLLLDRSAALCFLPISDSFFTFRGVCQSTFT